MRAARLLSAYVPRTFGGDGCRLSELAEAAEALARGCASTGMVFAMHQIQVACLVRPWQPVGVLPRLPRGGGARSSADRLGDVGGRRGRRHPTSRLRRRAERRPRSGSRSRPRCISYGAHADGILVTARRAPEADSHDQVLVLVRRGDYTLERTRSGTRSACAGPAARASAWQHRGAIDQILPAPFARHLRPDDGARTPTSSGARSGSASRTMPSPRRRTLRPGGRATPAGATPPAPSGWPRR